MEKDIDTLERYLEILSSAEIEFGKNNSDVYKEIFEYLIETASSILLLIKKDYVHQSITLLRSLGEMSLFIFVTSGMKSGAKNAYFALYELHGWYEVISIFKKSGRYDTEEYKKYEPKLLKHIGKLKKIIINEFSDSDGDEYEDDSKMRSYVTNKMNNWLYDDAEIILDNFFDGELDFIQEKVRKLLKSSYEYQTESHFVHTRYFSLNNRFHNPLNDMKDLKSDVINNTIERMHLVLSIYSVYSHTNEKLLDDLSELVKS